MIHRNSLVMLLVCAAAPAAAQVAPLKQPEPSPHGSVSQTVGLTEMTIDYHRPAVKGRKIWGGLVPYGEVWRAGANENTTITFSAPVTVGGKQLAAGRYGVHMLPAANGTWTVILSNVNDAWGSFTYDQKDDAARVAVKAQPAPMHEHLTYDFEDVSEGAAVVALYWDKLKVPLKIETDTPKVVMTSMRGELRGLHGFFAPPWAQAARYWLAHGGDVAEAEKMVDRSIKTAESFENLDLKATILAKRGNAQQAAELRTRALAMASENELNLYGYRLINEKKLDEAIRIFQVNIERHPDSWNAHDSLGEAYAIKGDKQAALASYNKALGMVKDEVQRKRIEGIIAKLKAGK